MLLEHHEGIQSGSLGVLRASTSQAWSINRRASSINAVVSTPRSKTKLFTCRASEARLDEEHDVGVLLEAAVLGGGRS